MVYNYFEVEKSGPNNRGWTYYDQITADNAGAETLEFYCKRYPHSDRQTWRQHIEAGLVRLNDSWTTCDTVLQTGQRLSYYRPPWQEPPAPAQYAVAYADEDLAAIIKPAGLPVLPGGQFLDRTLLHLVRDRFGQHLSPLHRLGRGTSGLVLFAASKQAKKELSRAFREEAVEKTYRAMVIGTPTSETFVVDVPIGQVPYPPVGRLFAATVDGARARSDCRVLRRDPVRRESLLEVHIPTGRPHQIRIHLAAAGFPIVGDPLYVVGGTPRKPNASKRPPLPGDCGYLLHSQRLRFVHPTSKEQLDICCRAPASLRLEGE